MVSRAVAIGDDVNGIVSDLYRLLFGCATGPLTALHFARDDYGTGSPAKIRSTIVSLVIDSASAS